jgi:hypothetical protein
MFRSFFRFTAFLQPNGGRTNLLGRRKRRKRRRMGYHY